jgi:hypothetical protein
MRDKRDSQKKRFIETLSVQGTVYHAAQAAGVSRWTAYRWRHDDLEFAQAWDEAIENAVDAVESVIYQQAVGGNTLAAIFYLKAHRPQYRDRLNINVRQLHSEIEEAMARWKLPGLTAKAKKVGEEHATCRQIEGHVR